MYSVVVTQIDGSQTRMGDHPTRRGAQQFAATLISDRILEVRVERTVWCWRNDWVDMIRADIPA